jgi:hypothetical protein
MLTLTHDQTSSTVTLLHNATPLFHYNYAPTYDPWESRKPYFHPLCSLAGNTLTGYRPHDHVWHKGVQMTCAHLSVPNDPVGQNFWGGNTYVHGKGYIKVDNVGTQRHDEWLTLTPSPTRNQEPGTRTSSPSPAGNSQLATGNSPLATLAHRLTWITAANQPWISETRTITLPELNETDGYYALDFRITLKNIHTEQLLFGSPTTAGRPNAGYGGLFWRGPRDFLNGKILAGNALEGPNTMGQRAPWLAYQGAHDGTADRSTLLFVDRPGNPDYPNKWFVRNDPFPVASFAFSFDREVPLDPNRSLTLNHRLVAANGTWSRDRIEQYLKDANLHD